MAHRRTKGNVIYCPFNFCDNETLICTYRTSMEELAKLDEAGAKDSDLNKGLDWLEAEIDARYNKGLMSSMDLSRMHSNPSKKAVKKSSQIMKINIDEGPSAA